MHTKITSRQRLHEFHNSLIRRYRQHGTGPVFRLVRGAAWPSARTLAALYDMPPRTIIGRGTPAQLAPARPVALSFEQDQAAKEFDTLIYLRGF